MGFVLIGYWRSAAQPQWPDPHDFVDESWDPNERLVLAGYLDSGCRPPFATDGIFVVPDLRVRSSGTQGAEAPTRSGVLAPARPGECNGSNELSDGVYIWPEGLSHYVREHSVRLPTVFVEHTRTHTPPGDVGDGWYFEAEDGWWKSARPDW